MMKKWEVVEVDHDKTKNWPETEKNNALWSPFSDWRSLPTEFIYRQEHSLNIAIGTVPVGYGDMYSRAVVEFAAVVFVSIMKRNTSNKEMSIVI